MSTYNLKKCPTIFWLIHDPMDGPHLFKSENAAWRQYEKWKKEAKDDVHDSFWDMSEPVKYCRAEED
jgi:hypothetical protein